MITNYIDSDRLIAIYDLTNKMDGLNELSDEYIELALQQQSAIHKALNMALERLGAVYIHQAQELAEIHQLIAAASVHAKSTMSQAYWKRLRIPIECPHIIQRPLPITLTKDPTPMVYEIKKSIDRWKTPDSKLSRGANG